jgi:chemotaxis signal transduction protein
MIEEIKSSVVELNSATARTYCTFHLQNGLYGIDALAVKEITVLPCITPIPHAPPEVRGYVNLRGQIVLVLDSNQIVSGISSTLGPDSRLIVCRAHLGDPFGILADGIGDIWELNDDKIEKYEVGAFTEETAACFSREELIFGMGKLEGGLLAILDARRLLPIIEAVIEHNFKKTYHRTGSLALENRHEKS